MKIDFKYIMIAALIGVVVLLILTRSCGRLQSTATEGIDTKLIYDSIERVIKSQLPPPDTIVQLKEKTVVKWLPGTRVVDTVYLDGEAIHVYHDAEVDTNAILTHFLTQAVTYIDTIRDSALQAVISDTIFRNRIEGRGFSYKLLTPKIVNTYKPDRFQLILSMQAGGAAGYDNTLRGIYGGVDVGLKFKSGTYFSLGYMAGSSHFATIRAGQVIRLRKRSLPTIP